MKLLLDTHALIWFAEDSDRLSDEARNQIESAENLVYVSVASIWEIIIKKQIGKLKLKPPLDAQFQRRLMDEDIQELPIEFMHVTQTGLLRLRHRDPFDRLLIAQAIVEGLTIVSQDKQFDRYPVERLW